MYLIVGLGNPGSKYAQTRHNVGFLFVDWMRENGFVTCPPVKGGCPKDRGVAMGNDIKVGFDGFSELKKGFQGTYCAGEINGNKVFLLKPETYMNLSGKSVQACASFYKIPPKNIIIISDDIDMTFGKVRFRETGSAGGHNGIASIIECLGTSDIKRIKIGIDRHPHIEAADWVLSKLTKDELRLLEEEVFVEVQNKLEEKIA